MYCPNCGTPVKSSQAYCGECGHFINTNTNQGTPLSVEQAETPPPAPPPTGNYPIPAGYIFDRNSGLYYESSFVTDPATRQTVQYVRYFNPQSGQFMDAAYSTMGAGLPVQQVAAGGRLKQIPQWGWIALIVLITGIIIFFLVNTLGDRGNKVVKGRTDITAEESQQETYIEYRRRREKEIEDEYEKAMEEARKPISLADLDPVLDPKGELALTQSEENYQMFQAGDYYYFATLKGQDKTYSVAVNPEAEFAIIFPEFEDELLAFREQKDALAALPKEQESTEEAPQDKPVSIDFVSTQSPSPEEEEGVVEGERIEVVGQSFVGNTIYRMPIKGGPAEVVMTANNESILIGFSISGDQIVYVIMPDDGDGFGTYSELEIWTVALKDPNSHRLITKTNGGPIGVKDGFIYNVEYSNGTLNIWGKDKETGEFVASAHEMEIPFSSTFHMGNLFLEGNELQLLLFDYSDMKAIFMNYNTKTQKTQVLYEGEQFYLYRGSVFYDNKLYTARYEGYNEGYQNVDVGVIDLSSTTPSFKPIYTTERVLWKDKTPFFYLDDEKEELYYQKDDKIVKAPLTDLSKTQELFTLTSPIMTFSTDIVVFEDGSRYSLVEKKEVESITYGTDAPLIEGEIFSGRNPNRYLNSIDPYTDFNYLDYDLDYTFHFDENQSPLLNAVMNTAIYFEEDSYYSLYSFEYPEYSRLLLEEPAIGSVFITPDGSLDVDNWSRFLYDAVDYSVSPQDFIALVENGEVEGLIIIDDKVHLDPAWIRENRLSVVSYEAITEENAYGHYYEYTLTLSDGTTRDMEMFVIEVPDSLVTKIQVNSVNWEEPSGGSSAGYGSGAQERFGLPPVVSVY